MEKIIGFLSFNETLPEAVIDEINRRNIKGVKAEHCLLKETRMDQLNKYRVIIDRVSHLVSYYRAYLKNAALSGTYIINNPFWMCADDKFYNYSLAYRLGISVPKTVCLPPRSFSFDVEEGDLKNLVRELDWDSIIEYIGLPAIIKPYDGYGWRQVHKVSTMTELFERYEESGEMVMVLQEYINYGHYVRCFVLGKKFVLPIRYDPTQPFGGRQYIVDHDHLTPDLGERIVKECLILNRALGYDMNTVEFAIRDDIPYALDFMNPIPDTEPGRISKEYFLWVVDKLATVAIEYALSDKTNQIVEGIDEFKHIGKEMMIQSEISETVNESPVNEFVEEKPDEKLSPIFIIETSDDEVSENVQIVSDKHSQIESSSDTQYDTVTTILRDSREEAMPEDIPSINGNGRKNCQLILNEFINKEIHDEQLTDLSDLENKMAASCGNIRNDDLFHPEEGKPDS